MLSVATFAQNKGTLLSETFDSPEMPEGWKITGGQTQNWSISESNFCGGDAYEVKLDYSPVFYNAFTRLTSPSIDLTGVDSVMLSFKHYVDIYTTYPSTIGIATSSSNGIEWNVCWEESFYVDGQHNFNKVIANEDMGKENVMFCVFFRGNSANINAVYFDDIEIMTIEKTNAKVASIDIPNNIGSGNTDITFTIQNVGIENITVFEAEYSIDDKTYSQSFETNIANNESKQFTFEQNVNLKPGKIDVIINIKTVNGKEDEDPANNTITKEVNVALGSTQRIPLIEHFSSSSCTYCVPVDNAMHTLTDNNEGKFTYVKYPLNFPSPGDPYNTAECNIRKEYYKVSGAPNVALDGLNYGATSISQYQLDANRNKTAYVNIKGAFDIEDKTINITTDIMSYINLNNVKAFVSVNEKKTTDNVTTNGETEFFHIMMKMLNDANGNDIEIKQGDYQRLEFTYDMSNTYVEEMNDLEVAVWIQDLVSGEVFNSSFIYEYTEHPYPARNLVMTENSDDIQITWEAPEQGNPTGYNLYFNNELVLNNTKELSYITTKTEEFYFAEVVALYDDKTSVGIINTSIPLEEEEGDTTNVISNYETKLEIYPNPAKDEIHISSEEMIEDVVVYDVYGRQQVNMTTRQQDDNVTISVSDLNNGIYFVKVKTINNEIIKRFLKF